MSTTEQSPTVQAEPVFRRIPLNQLHRSPTQPRLVYPEQYIAELAADIKSHGRNLQALLVRPRVPELFKGDPDAVTGYEVVFGSCREKACAIAGVDPWCEIREMSDTEAERAQISENLQRKDVHPFEEAQSYQSLIERHGDTPDAIAARTGKSRSYIYGRLKLLEACPAIRKSCLAGEIDAEVALLIARLRTEKLQEKALARIKGKFWDLEDGGKKSFRNIRDLLKEEFTLNLKGALWLLEDAALLPSAGACTTCPKRSANAPEYEDLLQPRKDAWRGNLPGDPNLCTDPDCWAAKKNAQLKADAAKLIAKGATVIDGNKARQAIGADGKVKGAYIAVSEVKADLTAKSKGKPFPVKPTIVTIQNPRDGKTVQAYKVEDLKRAGVKVTGTQEREAANAQRSRARQQAQQAEKETEAAKLRAFNLELLDRTMAAMGVERSAQDLYLVVKVALEGVTYHARHPLAERWGQPNWNALTAHAGQLDVKQLNKLLMECALVDGVFTNAWDISNPPRALHATAKRYGVSITAMLAEPAPTPSPAAQAVDPAAKPVATNAKRPPARYKNQVTGETWNGRGLMPKWLKVATAAGAKLTDFEQPSDQAGSAGEEKGGAAGAEGGPAA